MIVSDKDEDEVIVTHSLPLARPAPLLGMKLGGGMAPALCGAWAGAASAPRLAGREVLGFSVALYKPTGGSSP